MKLKKSLWLSLLGLGVGLFVACSADPPDRNSSNRFSQSGTSNGNAYTGILSQDSGRGGQSRSGPTQSPATILSQISVKHDLLPYGARGRSRKSMKPQYITIHSTQNWSEGADANRHSLALKNGALGRLSWHYTTDENRAVQHLPTTEQGNHADYDGPGNRYSIGIEMCEHPGNSRSATLERTAKLAAWLCVKHNLSVSKVVPHYKWPRHGKNPANKNCPHFLLDNGRPGAKWQGFLKVVEVYHRSMTGG